MNTYTKTSINGLSNELSAAALEAFADKILDSNKADDVFFGKQYTCGNNELETLFDELGVGSDEVEQRVQTAWSGIESALDMEFSQISSVKPCTEVDFAYAEGRHQDAIIEDMGTMLQKVLGQAIEDVIKGKMKHRVDAFYWLVSENSELYRTWNKKFFDGSVSSETMYQMVLGMAEQAGCREYFPDTLIDSVKCSVVDGAWVIDYAPPFTAEELTRLREIERHMEVAKKVSLIAFTGLGQAMKLMKKRRSEKEAAKRESDMFAVNPMKNVSKVISIETAAGETSFVEITEQEKASMAKVLYDELTKTSSYEFNDKIDEVLKANTLIVHSVGKDISLF